MSFGSMTPAIKPSADHADRPLRSFCGGLFQRRVCLVPTWRGWLILFLVLGALFIGAGRKLCTFLSVREPVLGGVLVVEGWVPPYAAREAAAEFRRNTYSGIYAVGEPIEEGDPYFGTYPNLADLTAARLIEYGLSPAAVHAVPAPAVGRDRTYTMARTLKHQLEADGVSTAKINVYSVGPHARRSRLLYEFAFGPNSKIGMVAVPPRDLDSDHWWRTSAGVRGVVDELVAYAYARFILSPGKRADFLRHESGLRLAVVVPGVGMV